VINILDRIKIPTHYRISDLSLIFQYSGLTSPFLIEVVITETLLYICGYSELFLIDVYTECEDITLVITYRA
jgi:hypothetical protein